MTGQIEIRRADVSQKLVVYNLLQVYLHTFASMKTPEDPQWRFNALGQLDYPDFNAYWGDRSRHPYLIYANGDLAGFALINDGTASGRKTDFFVGEFFIAGKYRKHGTGRKAALAIFKHHPGLWELGVVEGNAPALTFWEKTLQSPEIKDLERLPGAGDWKNGSIFRFSV